jgi:hypothetical protein
LLLLLACAVEIGNFFDMCRTLQQER